VLKANNVEQDKENSKKRKRGQQPDSKGHGRRRHENLPSKEEIWALPDDEQAGVPQIITAPGPAKLIPKGGYGISFWVFILLGKFLYQRLIYRILTELRDNHGLDISPGTATSGMERLRSLFVPLYQEIVARNLSEERWHADETRWQVFAEMEGKENPPMVSVDLLFQDYGGIPHGAHPLLRCPQHFGEEAKGILVVRPLQRI
jgi:transposase